MNETDCWFGCWGWLVDEVAEKNNENGLGMTKHTGQSTKDRSFDFFLFCPMKK